MKKYFITSVVIIFLTFLQQISWGDCVYGAKLATSFTVLDSNTLILKGPYLKILVKTDCLVSSLSNVSILKDSFCDYEDAVLYIDGEVCGVSLVKNLE